MKINPAVLGGVDKAIRDYTRQGAPSLAISVTDADQISPATWSLTTKGQHKANQL